MVYLITHGKRDFGLDPRHTREGAGQIRDLAHKLERLPREISLVIIGTGIRFYQIYRILISILGGIPIKFSPFCGSADGLEADGKIITVDNRTVIPDDYIGLIGSSCFNAWEFVSNLPNNALLCSGGELLIALGQEKIYKKGQLYELDPETKTAKKIQ